ncbi:transposable element Tcb1 transposase [Trichonephila clavipes]|nr:transposable element Tcb1 transposase [Trichonephila clavipes]
MMLDLSSSDIPYLFNWRLLWGSHRPRKNFKTVIYNRWLHRKKYLETGSVENKLRPGGPSKLTSRAKRMIVRSATNRPMPSAQNIVNELLCHHVTFQCLLRQSEMDCTALDLELFLETGSAGRRPGQGRRRWATTPNEDRYLVLTARRHRNMNATLLQQHLRSATGTRVSTHTVRTRLHGVDLYARRPMVCVRLTSRPSDRGSRNNPVFVHESLRFGGRGVLVYGGISIDGRTDLYIIQDGPLTARRYRDEILRPIVVPYVAAIGDDFILMDDNCRPHRANLVEDFLFEEGIVRMEWPAGSPDMNPIEHVWDALGRRVAGRQPHPQTLQGLERALLEEWDRIPQLVINSLIDSMPLRCSTLLAVCGNHTPW